MRRYYVKEEMSGPGLWDKYHVKNVGCLRVNKGYWSHEVGGWLAS